MNLQQLDLNLLVALDALLTEQSITRAAARLHLSPSATSGALGRLRAYFADELLTQVGRRMVMTPLAEALHGQVRDCLLHIQATIDTRPVFVAARATRTFTLMMSDYVATVLLPPALRRLERDAPEVRIEVLPTYQIPWETLDRGEIDFLVLPAQFIREPHPARTLFTDDYVCVVATDNPLVGEALSAEEFLSLGHVVTRVGTHRPPTVDGWFFEHFGHQRRIEVVAPTFTSAPHLLVGTRRVATMHRRLAEIYTRMLPLRIVRSPFDMPSVVETIQWHQYRDRDPALLWMQNILVEAMATGVAA